MTKNQIKLAQKNGTIEELKNDEIVKRIRLRYSATEENAILRKKIAGIDYNNEFAIYNEYVENVKISVKKELEIL